MFKMMMMIMMMMMINHVQNIHEQLISRVVHLYSGLTKGTF